MSNAAVVIFIGLVIFVAWFLARKGKAAKVQQDDQREAVRETNRSLKELNKSLGFPEGTGPTGIIVDGELPRSKHWTH